MSTDETRETHMPCDMGCQPDWHRDDCAIYLPASTEVQWGVRVTADDPDYTPSGDIRMSNRSVAETVVWRAPATRELIHRTSNPDGVGEWEVYKNGASDEQRR